MHGPLSDSVSFLATTVWQAQKSLRTRIRSGPVPETGEPVKAHTRLRTDAIGLLQDAGGA
jgi:hypothetical protein